uniref:FK506-binding protein n=1 Tax=Biomphalaria glabrata TaxID=6526 RepID=A0A2C9KRV7_BIOGL
MVLISDCQKMFWGVTIDAGKRYSQIAEQGFHVSMAALDVSSKKPAENVQVMLQRESSEYLLCTLHSNLLQQPLDLNFATGEEVSFSLNGSGVVHLTGYLIGDDDDEPSMEFSDDDEPPSLIDSSGDNQMLGIKRKAIGSLKDSKRMKLLDGIDSDDSDDDEDDEDYSEEEEGFSDEDDFDEESFDEEEDSDEDLDEEDSDEEEESPKKKNKADKTPAKSPANTPSSQKEKKQDANKSKQEEKTPKQQNGKAKQKGAATPATPKTPETPVTPGGDGEGESAKKKKKKKKKKNKGDNSVNDSTASTPGTPAATKTPESTPSATPKKRVVAGGTVVEDIKTGHGPEAKPGKMVSVYYVGTLAKNNKRFDSCTEGKPFRFRLNQGEVIKGWDVGLTGMKVGGKRKITIPPNQGYGNSKAGAIPPNSTLVFEVELKAVS